MNITLDSCRICLGKRNLQSIFEEHDIPISEKIVYCASVQVFQNDSLPEMICNQCLFYLDIAYVFKTVCEATDNKLREHMRIREIKEFDIPDDVNRKCFADNKNKDISGLLIVTSNKSNNWDSLKKTYLTNVIRGNNSEVQSKDSAEIENFIDEHNIEETILNQNIEDIRNFKEGVEVLIVQEETEVKFALKSEENVEYLASEETQLDIGGDKQIVEGFIIQDNSAIFEKQKENTLDDADYNLEKNMLKENTKDKVGRHIAKKIAGKFPQKLLQNNGNIIDEKQGMFKKELRDESVSKDMKLGSKIQEDDFQNFENILETDMPVVVFEETVVTDNEIFPYHTENIVNKTSDYKQADDNDKDKLNSEKITRVKKNERPKIKIKLSPMTLRKGNRKVNVFDDHSKKIKSKQKKKVKELTKNTVRGILTKKTKDGFKCDVCNKSFPFRSHLIRHLNMHTGIKRYTCEYCKQKFINNYNLSVHMLKHTGEFPLKCELCSKGFPNPSLLKRHMTSHTGETNFQCGYCSVKFTQSSSLKLHERMHLHRPSYHCDICYKVFSYTNSLAAHKKLHFGAKRFSCDTCLTTFSRKSSLIRHMEGHTKSKRIKCKFCDISFNSKNNYYSHLNTHCKYKCDVCGGSFRYKTNLVNHVKNHKDGLKCEQCYKQFQNKVQLVKHLEKHIK